MFCKQCLGKQAKVSWTDEVERADEVTKPLSVYSFELHPELSDSDMAELQAKDPTLFPVIDDLSTGTTPTFEQLKMLRVNSRNLWSQRPAVNLVNGVLVRQKEGVTQLVVPSGLRKRLFDHVHAGPLAAHLGSECTLKQLQQSYYWPGMHRDVVTWCHACDTCALSKGRLKVSLKRFSRGHPLMLLPLIYYQVFP